ncbi:MAG: cytochrome c3 family protein [Phycisphaerales bacterium]|nr:cytochrome c3 family protein [Phycisphaerales bacterium]
MSSMNPYRSFFAPVASARLVPIPLILALGLAPQATQPAATQPASRPSTRPATAPAAEDVAERLSLGIVGSKHDFTGGGRVARDLCLPCHTMHLTATQAPLVVQRPTTSQPIRLYQTPGMDLDASSLLCLSCHDGIAAKDVFTQAHAGSWDALSGRRGGPRLTGHPVGVKYPVGEDGYESPEYVSATAGLKLPDGRIQCTTCHDPHNTGRHPGMLVIGNERSRLCLSCHRL